MDLRRLRYFVAVAEKMHFGHAADSVNVVQSAISQQIKLLEAELGVVLLERSRPYVKLTEAGRAFLPECKRVLQQAEEATRVAKQAGAGYVGRIRVGFVDNALWSLLPPLIRDFRSRFPRGRSGPLPPRSRGADQCTRRPRHRHRALTDAAAQRIVSRRRRLPAGP